MGVRVGQQGWCPEAPGVVGPDPQELLSDVWSSFGYKADSGGTLLSVPATFGCGRSHRGWGLFYEHNKMELNGQGLCMGTGWTIQGVSKSA